MAGVGWLSNWNGYVSSPDVVDVEKVDGVRSVGGPLYLGRGRRGGTASCGPEGVCVAMVDVVESGALLLTGPPLKVCCLANIEPADNGLPLGLAPPGERGGRAEIGEGGTNGNPAKTESACEDVVFALRMEWGRTLSSSSSRSTDATVRPPLVSMLMAREGMGLSERADGRPDEVYAEGLCMPRMTRDAVPMSARILTPSAVLAVLTGRLL